MNNPELTQSITTHIETELRKRRHFHLDTDSMRLSEPSDRSDLIWLASIAAEFVLAERIHFKEALDQILVTIDCHNRIMWLHDERLEKLRETVKESSLPELIKLIKNYQQAYIDAENYQSAYGTRLSWGKVNSPLPALNHDMIVLEAERLVISIYRILIGSGGLRVKEGEQNEEEIRRLAGAVELTVQQEVKAWEPQMIEAQEKLAEVADRCESLYEILSNLGQAVSEPNPTVENIRELLADYRSPLEEYYRKMRESHGKSRL